MNRGLYASGTAMVSAQQLLDVVSHNLANVSTNGYKREGLVFNDTLQRALYSDGGRYVGKLGSGGYLQEHFTVMEQGQMTTTGNALDVAIQGPNGFFAVQTPNGVRYTRDGAFALDSERRLTTQDGHPVLDTANREITVTGGKIEVNGQGDVSVDGQQVATIGVFEGQVTKIGDGLFEGKAMKVVDEPVLQSGVLEGSNVNAIEEMIAMIQLNRIYEMAQRGALSQDEMTQKLLTALQNR
jgi:flagellar basal body rod protein FlgG